MALTPKPPWGSLDELQRELFPEVANDEDSPSIGFVTRLIVATSLPHSAPADSEVSRGSGLYDLCLLSPRRIGLPYGVYPRLALAAWTSEAVRNQAPLLSLGRTFSNFALNLGLTPSTGPKGTLTALREQLVRLANLSVSLIGDSTRASQYGLAPAFAGGGVRLVKAYNFWWDDPPPESEIPNFVLLSDDFFQEVIQHPVPVSLDVLRSMRSPLMIDIYMWLTYRSIRSLRINRPEVVSWTALERQFGSAYAEPRMFRYNFLRCLKQVLKIYPARVEPCDRGLTLRPYPPHVARSSAEKPGVFLKER